MTIIQCVPQKIYIIIAEKDTVFDALKIWNKKIGKDKIGKSRVINVIKPHTISPKH